MKRTETVRNRGINCVCIRKAGKIACTNNPSGCQGFKNRRGIPAPLSYCIEVCKGPSQYAAQTAKGRNLIECRALLPMYRSMVKDANKRALFASLQPILDVAGIREYSRYTYRTGEECHKNEQAAGKEQSLARIAEVKLLDCILAESDWMLHRKEELNQIADGIRFILYPAIGTLLSPANQMLIDREFDAYLQSLETTV